MKRNGVVNTKSELWQLKQNKALHAQRHEQTTDLNKHDLQNTTVFVFYAEYLVKICLKCLGEVAFSNTVELLFSTSVMVLREYCQWQNRSLKEYKCCFPQFNTDLFRTYINKVLRNNGWLNGPPRSLMLAPMTAEKFFLRQPEIKLELATSIFRLIQHKLQKYV